MENALLIGLSRQTALAREMDVIANNMANVTTNGFKAREARFSEYLMPVARADSFQRPDQRLSYVIDSGTPLDLSTGAIEMTGNPLNAAIKGDGFFAVQTPQGERYTRNGAFELNAQGQLVTSDGHAVLGQSGPITLGPEETNVSISPNGTVLTSQGERGRIRMVRFADPRALNNVGANLFASQQPGEVDTVSRVQGGAIERSNVQAIVEMSRMIDVNRNYTSVAGMISRMDELRRTAISRLADANA
ncbi:MAG TPA: flagellar basal-body rod protein FlgF [Microvirga sp.]|jgi:flagellar basal-body rod protein FlgF|nr:flagellar basal-body rod protein FlgF [Microvirga sp.]